MALYTRSSLSRIPSMRPLRPPSNYTRIAFKSKRVHTSTSSRPQLPFLPSPSRISILRSLSTKNRADLRYQLRIFGYGLFAIWVAGTTVTLGRDLLRQQWLEMQYPTPPEWPFTMRYNWRNAQHQLVLDKLATGMPDWHYIGISMNRVIRKGLQDPEVKPNKDWDASIPGLDVKFLSDDPKSTIHPMPCIGEDLSAKSEDWKQAYFDAWMTYAIVAEKQVDMVIDSTRRMIFPKIAVVGPSNPDMPEILPGSIEPPLEENCIPPCESPNYFYTHILTCNGFNAHQRLEAALGFAAWIDHEGDSATAEKLYDWSMSLACSALAAEGTNPQAIVDPETKIIKSTAPFVTSNILKACTKNAEFQARQGNLSSALGIYTSILRAYRAAPDAPEDQQYEPEINYAMETWDGASRFFRSLWRGPPSLTLLPSGNAPFERTQRSKCDEASIMMYIGEILFATGSADAGLGWTRDATALAEVGFHDEKMSRPSHLVCSKCMGALLDNWHRMTETIVAEENKRKVVDEQTGEVVRVRKSWWESIRAIFGGSDPLLRLVELGDWHREAELVDEKRRDYMERRLLSELEEIDKGGRQFMRLTTNGLI